MKKVGSEVNENKMATKNKPRQKSRIRHVLLYSILVKGIITTTTSFFKRRGGGGRCVSCKIDWTFLVKKVSEKTS